MRFLSLLCLCLLQACSAMQDSTQKIATLFPFEQNIQKDYKLNFNNKIPTHPLFTKKAEQSFAYLAIDEAIRNDDYVKVMEASEALLLLLPKSQALSDAASWLLSNGYLEETCALLTRAAKKMPNDLAIHVMLSEAIFLQKEKNTDEVINVLLAYIGRNPNEYVAYMELALAYLKLEKPQKAYDTFNQLPENEKTHMVLYYTGFALKELGRLDEAVTVLKKALKMMPNFLEVILELAQIEEARKNYSAARKYYERVLEFDVYNQDIALRLVSIALKEGNPDRAFEIVQKNLESFSFIINASSMLMEEGRADLVEILLSHMAKQEDSPRELIYLQGALAYEGMGNKEKALMFLNQMTPEDKHYKNNLELKTQIYLEKNELTEAIETLQEAQKIFIDDMNFVAMEYQIYLYQGDYAKALPLLAQYTEANPDDSDAAFKYAFVHVHLGMKDKAFKLMEELLKKEPENHEILNFIGYTLVEKKKNLKYALSLIEKANTINPNADYILDSLAWAHYQLKNYEEAWKYIRQAISTIKETAVQDPTMWEHYGDIAFALKQNDEARLGWEKSLKLKNDSKIQMKLTNLQ